MDLLFVTGNLHKFEEVKKIADRYGVNVQLANIPIVEQKLSSVKEVAIAKALSAVKMLNRAVIVEDTGLYLEAYDNFPGTNAKSVLDGIGCAGILRLLEGKDRRAKFVTAFAFATPKHAPICFVAECNGKIAEKPSEIIDFPYDTIFIPDGCKKTFSEMTKDEKEEFSNRAKALKAFLEWFLKEKDKSYLKEN